MPINNLPEEKKFTTAFQKNSLQQPVKKPEAFPIALPALRPGRPLPPQPREAAASPGRAPAALRARDIDGVIIEG